MKKYKKGRKSTAITRRQLMMSRKRAGNCIDCGGPQVACDTPVGAWLPMDDKCGDCRRKEFSRERPAG